MYTLYDGLQTGGVSVKAALEEAGIEYQRITVDLQKKEHLSEEYTRINPRQQVPSLMLDDGSIMTEGAAIMIHIADCHPNANLLAPTGTAERAQAMRWLLFLDTNVYEGENRKVHPEWYVSAPECAGSVYDAAIEYVNRHYLLIENVLGNGPYLFGDRLDLVDIYVWMLVQWQGDLDWLDANCPKVVNLVRAVMSRPKIEPLHLETFGVGIGLTPEEKIYSATL